MKVLSLGFSVDMSFMTLAANFRFVAYSVCRRILHFYLRAGAWLSSVACCVVAKHVVANCSCSEM